MSRLKLQQAETRFEALLSQRAMRLTPQRRAVFRVLYQRKDHVSADDLADAIKKKDRTISKATVYRTLSLLEEAGLVSGHDFRRGSRVYEFVDSHKGHEHHDHILCVDGQSVVEFFSRDVNELGKRIAEKFGFEHVSHEMKIYAKCAACRDGSGAHTHEHGPGHTAHDDARSMPKRPRQRSAAKRSRSGEGAATSATRSRRSQAPGSAPARRRGVRGKSGGA